jgi:hypothetical protein
VLSPLAHSLTHLLALLDALTRPFIQRAVADLRARQQLLLLDVDLTDRPVTSLALPALIIRALLSVSLLLYEADAHEKLPRVSNRSP